MVIGIVKSDAAFDTFRNPFLQSCERAVTRHLCEASQPLLTGALEIHGSRGIRLVGFSLQNRVGTTGRPGRPGRGERRRVTLKICTPPSLTTIIALVSSFEKVQSAGVWYFGPARAFLSIKRLAQAGLNLKGLVRFVSSAGWARGLFARPHCPFPTQFLPLKFRPLEICCYESHFLFSHSNDSRFPQTLYPQHQHRHARLGDGDVLVLPGMKLPPSCPHWPIRVPHFLCFPSNSNPSASGGGQVSLQSFAELEPALLCRHVAQYTSRAEPSGPISSCGHSGAKAQLLSIEVPVLC